MKTISITCSVEHGEKSQIFRYNKLVNWKKYWHCYFNMKPVKRSVSAVGQMALRTEKPSNLSILGMVLLFEGELTRDKVVDMMKERVIPKYSRFSSRVEKERFILIPDFDFSSHVSMHNDCNLDLVLIYWIRFTVLIFLKVKVMRKAFLPSYLLSRTDLWMKISPFGLLVLHI